MTFDALLFWGGGSLYDWVIFPVLIFSCRVCDVSLATLRSVLSSRGKKKIVPFIGFFEVLLWLVAVSQILRNLSNVPSYLAWASGYATGIYVGLWIEEKLAIGTQVIRIITPEDGQAMAEALRAEQYGVTIMEGMGGRGPVQLLFTVVKRKEVTHVVEVVQSIHPGAFYSVEDCRTASQVRYSKGKRKRILLLDLFKK
jgi:uncharacterized protein YebE (UPF0316 family)